MENLKKMRILLTGGSGDLGQALIAPLEAQGYTPLVFDIREPRTGQRHFIHGSLLKRENLTTALENIDLVIHIAAWHGIHEARNWKQARDFWELNVDGTYHLLESCVTHGVQQFVHISSSSVLKSAGVYGFTKRLAEETVGHFHREFGLDSIILRPRAFIPHWNRQVYANYLEWVKRFWPGAVHIQDVVQAVMRSVDYLSKDHEMSLPILTIDRTQDYSSRELEQWDADGSGSSFRRVFADFEGLVRQHGLNPSIKPLSLDISQTKRLLSYQPTYGLKELLLELQKFGNEGPPIL